MGVERNIVEKVHCLASDPKILERLVESVAPDIYSLKEVKKALLYSLLGGVSKESKGHRKRGNIHLLLVGDPGTGKSQLLRFAANVAQTSFDDNRQLYEHGGPHSQSKQWKQ